MIPPTPSTAISQTICDPKAQTILWLIEGNRTEDVLTALKARYPDEDPAALLNHAAEHFTTVAQADPAVIRGWGLCALQEIHRKCFDMGDYQGSLKAVKELLAQANKQCSAPPPDQSDEPLADKPAA